MNDKRTQKNIRRRRGAGIEMAMILMLVVVAFSALLTSTVLMQTQKVKRSTEQLEQLNRRVVLDQIGRDFCTHLTPPALPDGMVGDVGYTYVGPNYVCTGCCKNCEECNIIYAPPTTNDDKTPTEGGISGGENGGTGAVGDTGGAKTTEGDAPQNGETPEGSGTTESDGETAVQRPECCKDCECQTGCTGYKYITLQVYSDDSKAEIVLTVILERNDNGTHALTYWSYGG